MAHLIPGSFVTKPTFSVEYKVYQMSAFKLLLGTVNPIWSMDSFAFICHLRIPHPKTTSPSKPALLDQILLWQAVYTFEGVCMRQTVYNSFIL